MRAPIVGQLFLGICLVLYCEAAATNAQYTTEAQDAAEYSAADRIYSYSKLAPNSPAILAQTPYGTLKAALGSQFPFLTSLDAPGVSQLWFTLEPCSQFAPHAHPRANELLQVITGSIKGGLIGELSNGSQALYPLTLGPYDFTVFPTGLSHFVYNDGCNTTTMLAFFDDADPGTTLLVPTTLTLPDLSLQGALGVDNATVKNIRSMIQERTLFMSLNDPACLKKCNITTQAQ